MSSHSNKRSFVLFWQIKAHLNMTVSFPTPNQHLQNPHINVQSGWSLGMRLSSDQSILDHTATMAVVALAVNTQHCSHE